MSDRQPATDKGTADRVALAKIGEWTGICGDAPGVLVEELAALGFVVARRDQVEALSDAMWQLLDDMGAEGTSVCLSAKASARIAYEPFRVDADGEEAPLDYPLRVAESTLEEIRQGLRQMVNRPVTFLSWSTEPVTPLIKVEGGERALDL